MLTKRRWSQWPKRSVEELNGVSGVAGVGGAAIGIASLSLLAGTAAFALTGVGAVITLGAIGYAVARALPPPMKLPEDLVGRKVAIKELDNVFPPVRRLSIVGLTQAGKTTLRNRLAFIPDPPSRTQQTSAYVTSLQTAPEAYLAILDGGGDRFPQQFSIAGQCDCLCIVIDHNRSDSETRVDADRLKEHESFLKQIRHYLDESGAPSKAWIQFLFNKRDLWALADPAQIAEFSRFCNDEVERWRQGRRATVVDARTHSNDIPADVAQFMALLRNTARD